MTSTCRLAIAVTAAILAGSAPARAASRFSRVPEPKRAAPGFVPLALSHRPVTVVVEVQGDPVAVVNSRAATPLSRQQKEAVKARLRAAQAPIEDAVAARGGTVLARFHSAYNGVKVRIAADEARALAALPGVVGVHAVRLFRPENIHGVPLVGAPVIWGGVPGLHGEGVKVAIIDTGIDYTHADFGGPGTPAAYTAAHANETAAADPSLFGPLAPKVKGGTDFVGDSYNADPTSPAYQPIPHPDPNPLDCYGHGTHVAGTAVGFGVLADGSTFTGTYDASTVTANSWNVGPGVAPKADLYALRVFGCAGSSDVVVDAIDWAVDHDMDVISMSLGSDLTGADEPSAVAAANAAKAGIIVVSAAGNAGPAPYMSGSPAASTGSLSVAALDPTQSFPGANVALSTGPTVAAIDANGATFTDGTTLPVVVLGASTGTIALGCNPTDYAGTAGKLVVTSRGTCARVARAIYGQQAGAAAVLMVNNAGGYPPFEGQITSNPDTGEAYTVTIPFLGVPNTFGATFLAADGGTGKLTATTIANPGYLAIASFSSGGPRLGDSALKPEVTAPGVSIASAGMGTGNAAVIESGTSMATPHTSGVGALVRQAHPGWGKAALWRAAMVNTADPTRVNGYETRLAGAGLVQAPPAVATHVVAMAGDGSAALSFGFAELAHDFVGRRTIALRNLGHSQATFRVGVAQASGSPHSLVPLRSTVTVRPGDEADVGVVLTVAAKTAGDSSAFSDVAGLVTFTPVGGSNGGVALRVPYYLVPQALSSVRTRLSVGRLFARGSATATTTNPMGVIPGNADWYAWGLAGRPGSLGAGDVRAVGVQVLPSYGILAFAISTFARWSSPSVYEFDILVDVDGDGQWDYDVVGIDLGFITAGSFDGTYVSGVFTPDGNGSLSYFADAPTDSSTLVLPIDLAQLCATGHPCLSATSPRFTYTAQSADIVNGGSEAVPGSGSFNPFSPAVSNGMFDQILPGAAVTETVALDRTELSRTPPLGLMIVTHDNPAVGWLNEAQLISFWESD